MSVISTFSYIIEIQLLVYTHGRIMIKGQASLLMIYSDNYANVIYTVLLVPVIFTHNLPFSFSLCCKVLKPAISQNTFSVKRGRNSKPKVSSWMGKTLPENGYDPHRPKVLRGYPLLRPCQSCLKNSGLNR